MLYYDLQLILRVPHFQLEEGAATFCHLVKKIKFHILGKWCVDQLQPL